MRIYTLLFLLILGVSACRQEQNQDYMPFYSGHLSDYMNRQLNEAIIQDGFSPPVASRIYAYLNIGIYECFALSDKELQSLSGQLNGFAPSLPKAVDMDLYNPQFAAFQAYTTIARHLVYRDFIVDTLYNRGLQGFKNTLSEKQLSYSGIIGDSIAAQVISYTSTDHYSMTRSYPLYELKREAATWIPTPPMYGTAIEPYWGEIRPFVIDSPSNWLAPQPLPFDSNPSSAFYKESKEVYDFGKMLTDSLRDIALRWDGDPMPPYRLKHINVIKRQLNPVGHWLAISSIIASERKLTEKEHLLADVRIALGCADAMIVCWYNKFHYNLLRPHTYINRYIDESWDPLLTTPLFPEYPSGHSVLSGAASVAVITQYGDVSFTDSSGREFGFAPKYFSSITNAASDCAMSRVYGGVHYRQAVEVGVRIGSRLAAYHESRLKLKKPDRKTAWLFW